MAIESYAASRMRRCRKWIRALAGEDGLVAPDEAPPDERDQRVANGGRCPLRPARPPTLRGKPCLPPPPLRSPHARRRGDDRDARRGAPGSSPAPRPSSPRPSSSSRASISSTNSGFPAAASTIRCRAASSRPALARLSSSVALSCVGERLEADRGRVRLSSAPLRPRLEQLGAGDAHEENGRIADPVGDVVDEVEEGRLSPVDVVEDENERPTSCERLDEGRTAQSVSSPPLRRSESPTISPSRCATRSAPSLPSSRVASLARFSSDEAASSMPAASRTASRTGQYVIPSPYGRHRPRATSAPSATSSTNSRTRRDFPTPGAPMIVKSWQDLSPSACSNASWRRRRSRFAPDHRRIEATTGVDLDRTDADKASSGHDLRGIADEPGCAFVDKQLARRRRLLEANGHLHGLTGPGGPSPAPVTTRLSRFRPGAQAPIPNGRRAHQSRTPDGRASRQRLGPLGARRPHEPREFRRSPTPPRPSTARRSPRVPRALAGARRNHAPSAGGGLGIKLSAGRRNVARQHRHGLPSPATTDKWRFRRGAGCPSTSSDDGRSGKSSAASCARIAVAAP